MRILPAAVLFLAITLGGVQMATKIPIEQGVAMAYQSFLDEQSAGTLRE